MLSSSFPRFVGDYSGSFVLDLTKGIRKKGHFVIVLAPHENGIPLRDTMEGVDTRRFRYFYPWALQRLAYGDGIAYNIQENPVSAFQALFFFISELLGAIRLAKKENIEIINSHWLVPQGLVGAICKKILGIPHIATIHSSEITLLKKIPAGRLIAEFTLANSDEIVSVSRHRSVELSSFIRRSVWNSIRGRLEILPMGVFPGVPNGEGIKDELKARYGMTSKHVVLFVGRLIEVKGCNGLMEALGILKKYVEDVQLVVIGTGNLMESMKRTSSRLNLDDSVRFEGIVSRKDIWDYYALSDVVVVPSIVDSSGFQEGIPVVLLEAMASGKPIVATRTNGIMEVIRNNQNGILVESLNPGAIADAILRLLNDSELRKNLSRNALATAGRFSCDTITTRYADLIVNRTRSS